MFGLREAGYDNQWNSNDPLALELGSTSIEVCEGFLLIFFSHKSVVSSVSGNNTDRKGGNTEAKQLIIGSCY